jgi:hypothetical protein
MKKLVYLLIVPMMIAASSVSKAQDYAEGSLGLPGDNLNLFAVMKIFQESETLEGFERKLNDENSRINNLDLNGDNFIDYIRVIDQPKGDLHIIVLQVAINARENQDVAAFIVQREANNQVRIQLIGDEALYGKDYIIEPNYDTNGQYAGETPNPGYMGRTTVVDGQTVVVNRVTTYEVAAWPLIRFMFLPSYIVWHSPWYWDYYPNWWHPWRPYYWHYYYGYHYNWYPEYYGYYHHHHHYNTPDYHNYYYGHKRSYSPYVANHIKSGSYRSTYSHPETREQGSELYTNTYANNNRRTASGPSVNQQVSRPSTSQSNNSAATRRATPSRSSEVSTGRPSVQQESSKSTVRTETRRTATDTRVTGTSERKSTETATSKPSAQRQSSGSTVKTENRRTATDSRVSSTPSHRYSEATTSRPSAQRETSGSTMKNETRKPASESRVSNSSSSRRTSGSTQVKSTGKSSGTEKSGSQTKGTSSGRR